MKVLVVFAAEDRPRKDNADVVQCVASVVRALSLLGLEHNTFAITPAILAQEESLYSTICSFQPDCIFNLFEGFSHDAGAEILFARFLEKYNFVVTGNAPRALDLCLNKFSNKDVLRQAGVNVPRGFLAVRMSDLSHLDFPYPVFVKPVGEDASVGIDALSLCRTESELQGSLAKKLVQHPQGVLVEEFIDGLEFNASFVGQDPYEMLAVSALDYTQHPESLAFMSYEAKWNETAHDYKKLVPVVQKALNKPLSDEILAVCTRTARALGCGGYFRVDLRMRSRNLYVLDVNPNPDISEDAGFSRQALAAGYTYEGVIKKIINEAWHGKH